MRTPDQPLFYNWKSSKAIVASLIYTKAADYKDVKANPLRVSAEELQAWILNLGQPSSEVADFIDTLPLLEYKHLNTSINSPRIRTSLSSIIFSVLGSINLNRHFGSQPQIQDLLHLNAYSTHQFYALQLRSALSQPLPGHRVYRIHHAQPLPDRHQIDA
jgi:hypothetical protein